jgi:hypothetical protein
MAGSARRRRFLTLRVWTLLLTALSVAALVTAVALTNSDQRGLRVARGVADGSFHPIAGRFVADDTKLEECAEDRRCLEQAFGNVAYAAGPKAALALFERRSASDKTVAADCHRISHMIGSAALARFKGNVAQTFSRGSASCASGYYHGILDRAFAHVQSEGELVRAARSLCRGAGVRRRGFLDYQCTHGLGHGLMIQTGFDVPTALSVCGQLETRWDEVTCTGGVFMENGSTVYGLRSRWLKDDDPVYPCNSIKGRNKASCYLRVTTQMLRVNDFAWLETAGSCRALERKWRRYCFISFGRDAVEHTAENARRILDLCQLVGAAEGQCVYGAARTLANRHARTDSAAAFCHLAAPRVRGACFAGVGVVIGLLQPTDAERTEACARWTKTHLRACARAARLEVASDGRGAWG